MASSNIRGGLGWIIGKISFLKEWSDIGKGCPGKWLSHHPWRCRKNDGTSGHGLAGMVALRWWLDLMILEVFSNLNNSMIL